VLFRNFKAAMRGRKSTRSIYLTGHSVTVSRLREGQATGQKSDERLLDGFIAESHLSPKGFSGYRIEEGVDEMRPKDRAFDRSTEHFQFFFPLAECPGTYLPGKEKASCSAR
jgi:hypothetical protein